MNTSKKGPDDEESQGSRWIGCPLEEDYCPDRKQHRQERKAATAADRSKYKKSDLDQQKKAKKRQPVAAPSNTSRQGRVLAITARGMTVQAMTVGGQGEQWICSLRGALKKEKDRVKNLVTVGDFVLFDEISPGEGAIEQVLPRHSVLARADHVHHRQQQLLAANIDQVLITVSVVQPPLKPFLIDRYLIAAARGGMEGIIVINKIDLLAEDEEQRALYEAVLHDYGTLNIPIVSVSVDTGEGVAELCAVMANKSSVFSGQSGVGKTSLINVVTGLELRTAEVVRSTKKGAHTTSTTRLIPLENGGWCIDTPGIKSFGVWELKKEEVRRHFEEITRQGQQCHYPSCTHTHEPACAVKAAAEAGELSLLRLVSYQRLIEEAID